MELSFANLWQMLRLSVLDPGRAAEVVLSLPIRGGLRFAAVIVSAALSAIALWATYAAFPMTLPDGSVMEPIGPLSWAVMVGAGVFLLSGLIFVVGKLAGGKAEFTSLVLLLAWFQFVQLAMYIVQIVLLVLLPPLGVMATLASLGLTVWVLGHFTRVAHGFHSVAGPILGLVGGAVLLFLLLLSGA